MEKMQTKALEGEANRELLWCCDIVILAIKDCVSQCNPDFGQANLALNVIINVLTNFVFTTLEKEQRVDFFKTLIKTMDTNLKEQDKSKEYKRDFKKV